MTRLDQNTSQRQWTRETVPERRDRDTPFPKQTGPSETPARRSVAGMPAPHWFFRFMYDRESAAWERRRDEPEHRELVEKTADELAHVVAQPGPVADLGCGPGAHTLALARRGYEVVGIDGSPRMVEVARSRAAREEVGATFHVHDLTAPLRFADASLGGVLAILILQHLRQPPTRCRSSGKATADRRTGGGVP